MKFLAHLKLTQKLVLLALVPTLIMLSFGSYQSFNAVNLRSSSVHLDQMVKFSVYASDLVHQLQKERGMTAGFIGSKGAKFRDSIIKQRKSTDEKYRSLQDFLTHFTASDVSQELSQNLNKFLERLRKLDETRTSVTNLSLSLGDALSYYTGNNNALIKLIEQMSILAPDQEMAIKISAYANFLQGKERAGIERAVLTNVFSKDEFSGNLFNRFVELVTIQKFYISVFLSQASEEDINFYKNSLSGEFIKETDKIRKIALSSAKRTALVNELNKILGYGGLIHRFKNYMIRGDFKDQTLIVISAKNAFKELNGYQELPGTSAKIKADIEIIKAVITEYEQAANKISEMKSANVPINEIDSTFKINNGPALQAIIRLGKGNFGVDPTHWFKMQTGKINLLRDIENHLAEGLALKAANLKTSATNALIITLLISITGLVIAILLGIKIGRNLRHQIGGEPSEIEQVASQIANGSLRIDNNTGSASGIYAASLSMQQTLSVVIENEIQGIVDAARSGDLSKRVELDNKSGFYKSLGEGINDLVESSEAIITDTGRVFSSLSHGDLNQTITRQYQGAFNQLKEDANSTISKLKQVIEGDIQALVNSTLQGDLSNQLVLRDKQGFFKDMSAGINELVDSVNNIFNDTTNAMESMANGDLTQPITSPHVGQFNELKNNINKTMSNLESTITSLRDSSFIISSTSKEISDGNNSLSSRTEHQASALEQTAASMEELTSSVKNNADNTTQANQMADTAKSTALKGGDVMSQASIAMEEINHSSQKIAEIIGVIDEIAFQTNLLALNASVEAARAGEQGRGFAVVATEVRNLAGRSATAAKEIKELINDSVNKVETGVSLVNQSTKNQQEIVESINRVGNIIAEISLASREQSEGIEQINTAVTSMDDSTQQNAALAEQTSAAAVSLDDQMGEMSKLMEFFKVSNSSSASSANVKSSVSRPAVNTIANAPASKMTDIKSYSKPLNISKTVADAPQATSFDDDEWEEF